MHKKKNCQNCKELFFKCLLDLDSGATEQFKNPLPNVLNNLSSHLIKIHDSLICLGKDHERETDDISFSKEKYFKPYDYFLPKYNCFVEFDEQQHFTLPRLVSLELYPDRIPLGFDKKNG